MLPLQMKILLSISGDKGSFLDQLIFAVSAGFSVHFEKNVSLLDAPVDVAETTFMLHDISRIAKHFQNRTNTSIDQ